MEGVASVTPSLEAIAWTAADVDTLQRVGAALELPGVRVPSTSGMSISSALDRVILPPAFHAQAA